mgnify:CR=1 FL=1
MAYGGAGVDPSQLETQLALIMDLGRSEAGQAEEADGMQRAIRFPGPPMLKGGGFSIMGGYPGFMRPGNGLPPTVNTITIPQPPTIGEPPVIGEPPEPPIFTDGFTPGGGGTFFSTPEPPSFSYVVTDNIEESSEEPIILSPLPPPPSGFEDGITDGPPGGGGQPGGLGWWGGFLYWFGSGLYGGIDADNDPDNDPDNDGNTYHPPSASPFCHSDFDPSPEIPEFIPLPGGSPVPGPSEWDPSTDPDPGRVYICPGFEQLNACALCAGWETHPTDKPEIFVSIKCPSGTTIEHTVPGPAPGEPGYDGINPAPYFDPQNGRLKVPITPGCCVPGKDVVITVKFEYPIDCPGCTCCTINLAPGEPSGGEVVISPVGCKHQPRAETLTVRCCSTG